ncbi:sialidase/neuraminidase family protein [Paenibacillus cymbidii]|uniref:exo-alpha-sialidase n=1 Tax=Paenibacillus cymbidii TaxID=1639034 RepID=UPI001080802F|nr:exo-alpha-sialidase [Paenibacillus cymbidii]
MQGTQVPLDYSIHVDTIYSQIDDLYYWVHPRAGTIPGDPATVVLAMQKYYRIGDDYFGTVFEMRTHDVGQTWVGPIEHDGTLSRRRYGEGMDMVICDFSPQWHAATGKLIGMGHTAIYADNTDVPLLRAKNIPVYDAYSVYDEATHTWTPFKLLEIPDDKFYAIGGAGMQRLELPNGDMLVPCYYRLGSEFVWERTMWACTVLRCSFDGETVTYLEHGTELLNDTWSGLAEPSLTRFKGKYYMTLRGQKGEVGYVTSGDDGLHYDQPQVWKWDDGSDLRSYNTQQHWITHSDGLFLVYTRDTGSNGHVCRHRSPLFIAQVDPDRLVLLRDTERVLLEDRGADLGNFSTINVTADVSYVFANECLIAPGCQQYGCDGSVFAIKLQWNKPNGEMGP